MDLDEDEVIVLDDDDKLGEVSSFESHYQNFLNALDKTPTVSTQPLMLRPKLTLSTECSECNRKTKKPPLPTYPYKCGECPFGSRHRFVVMNHYQMNHVGESLFNEAGTSLAEPDEMCLVESCKVEEIEIRKVVSKKDRLVVPFDEFRVYKKELLECATCDYATYNVKDLQHHSKIHLLYYPYKCNLCDFTAEKSFTVFNHYQLNHVGDICSSSNASSSFKCHVCGFVTDNGEVHNEHALNCYIRKYCSVIHELTTNSDSFSCNMCSFKASHSFVLSNHVRMAHEFKNDSVNGGSNFISVDYLGAMYVVKDEYVITDS